MDSHGQRSVRLGWGAGVGGAPRWEGGGGSGGWRGPGRHTRGGAGGGAAAHSATGPRRKTQASCRSPDPHMAVATRSFSAQPPPRTFRLQRRHHCRSCCAVSDSGGGMADGHPPFFVEFYGLNEFANASRRTFVVVHFWSRKAVMASSNWQRVQWPRMRS